MYDTIKLTKGGLVGLGITSPQFGNVETIVKNEDVVQEYISVELAHLLGVPVPPGFIAKDEYGDWCFISVRVGIFEPSYNDEAAVKDLTIKTHPKAYAQAQRIDAFDYLIGNSDRHPGNAVWTSKDSIAAIDHGFALSSGTRFPGYAGKLTGSCPDSHNKCLDIIQGWISRSLLTAALAIFDTALELFEDDPDYREETEILKRNFISRVEAVDAEIRLRSE